MGVLSGIKESDICALLNTQDIDNTQTFLVVRRHNGFFQGLLKLLMSNLYYAMDSTVLRIIAATEKEFIVINPNWTLKGDYKNLDPKYTTRIPWDRVKITITSDSRVAKIRWSADGKEQTWVADIGNPGVWHFNPQHLKNFIAIASDKGSLQC